MVVKLNEEQQQTEQENSSRIPNVQVSRLFDLAASLVNAGTIPLGKLSDIDKIGTQTEIFPVFGCFSHTTLSPGDYFLDLPEVM
ncbi:ADQ_G0034310.mRNA.1.CDS.1 [Saccharomyces cerevisiae]|nr:ADQ_G0034310.mRNA.1.CDS.1 [Saccharomyces cerevisiae]CAI6783273.1 ADQ_G0034310.mRNA.1.CDS.1 [Saccharomyces cerevisiae]